MKDFYRHHLEFIKFLKLLEKECTAKTIIKKLKLPQATVYRMLQSLEKNKIITVREIKPRTVGKLQLFKLKKGFKHDR